MGNIVGLPSPRSDWNQTDETKADYIKNKPVIDTEMSDTSENAVQNKVIKSYVDEKIGDIDAVLEELHNYAQALIGGAE